MHAGNRARRYGRLARRSLRGLATSAPGHFRGLATRNGPGKPATARAESQPGHRPVPAPSIRHAGLTRPPSNAAWTRLKSPCSRREENALRGGVWSGPRRPRRQGTSDHRSGRETRSAAVPAAAAPATDPRGGGQPGLLAGHREQGVMRRPSDRPLAPARSASTTSKRGGWRKSVGGDFYFRSRARINVAIHTGAGTIPECKQCRILMGELIDERAERVQAANVKSKAPGGSGSFATAATRGGKEPHSKKPPPATQHRWCYSLDFLHCSTVSAVPVQLANPSRRSR